MKKAPPFSWLVYALLVAIAIVSLNNVGLLDISRLARGVGNTLVFARDLVPPNPAVLPTVSRAMLETFQIAFVGTLLGFLLSLPLALLASRNLLSPLVTSPTKVVLGVVRTVPSLVWALLFVIALGLGPGAGALAIAFYTVGYLGKLYYETFEGVDKEVLEAVKSVGCNRVQLVRFALLPEAANSILSQLLFMFEYNVRASAIIGFVGAGGIGFYMLGYIQMLQYQNLLTTLLVTLAVVLLFDQFSALIRSRVLPKQTRTL
ncbi:MAG: phosphonate ABC transporter, permease protein PhnE [Chloroflexota bacterium]|nr:phosphonate ABC transporter, permease protein PhnE [Chloroflexota bacterium]